MESEAMPKESKRRKVRCGRETYGKYIKTIKVRLEMDTLLEGKASGYESISKWKRKPSKHQHSPWFRGVYTAYRGKLKLGR